MNTLPTAVFEYMLSFRETYHDAFLKFAQEVIEEFEDFAKKQWELPFDFIERSFLKMPQWEILIHATVSHGHILCMQIAAINYVDGSKQTRHSLSAVGQKEYLEILEEICDRMLQECPMFGQLTQI
jgi:hypothetical protein